jgi:hypothetical protein
VVGTSRSGNLFSKYYLACASSHVYNFAGMAAWAEEAGVGGEGPNDPMKLVIQAALLRKVIVRALILAFPAITLDLVQELGSALEFSQGPLIAEKMTQVILYSLPRFALLRMLIGN